MSAPYVPSLSFLLIRRPFLFLKRQRDRAGRFGMRRRYRLYSPLVATLELITTYQILLPLETFNGELPGRVCFSIQSENRSMRFSYVTQLNADLSGRSILRQYDPANHPLFQTRRQMKVDR